MSKVNLFVVQAVFIGAILGYELLFDHLLFLFCEEARRSKKAILAHAV